MSKVERTIINFIEKNAGYLFLVLMTLVGIYARKLMLPFMSSDLTSYNLEWYNQLKEMGGIKGISSYSGNYNYAYIFLLALLTYIPVQGALSIKVFHIMFDFVGAIIAGLIAKKVYSGGMRTFSLAYSLVFLSPIVMLNSAYWGQCDFIYTSFVLLAIYLLLEEKYVWCFLIYGVAISFKLQAIFIIPLFIFVYVLNKKYSVTDILMIPIGFLISSFPGMICSGKGLKGLFEIYFGQVKQEESLVLNFPNIYYWISANHYDLYVKLGVCLLFVIFAVCVFYLLMKKAYISNEQIVALGMWCVLCVVYFCPKMHERYGFVAEVLSLIWLIGHKKWIWYPIVINLTVLFSYFTVLYGYNLYSFQNMALINIISFIFFSIYTFSEIKTCEEAMEKNEKG